MNKEKRSITSDISVSTDSRLVEGYAILWNTYSKDLGGFIETIEPHSLTGVIERSDVFCYLDHNEDRGVLGRSKYGKGSLVLAVDDIGLRYLFEAPKTALGDELLEYLRREDITGSSFAFTVQDDEWKPLDDGMYLRTIKQFNLLFDVSPVFNPAYDETTVAQRSLKAIEESKELALKKELDNYFINLRNQIQ